MLTLVDLEAQSLLLPTATREALREHWEADKRHPRRFGSDCFEANQARQRALHETRRRVMASFDDKRPVGVQAPDTVVYVGDLLADAAGQLVYEIETTQPGRVPVVRRKVHAWEDARQCADDLGILPVASHDAALRELVRVGLAWTIDAARTPSSRQRME
jgi:hypothetical protein